MFTGYQYTHGVNLFRNTHSNTVSLFAKQGPAKIQDKGLWDSMELLLIDVAQVYMNLLWFENLLLMRLWVWNAYLVLLWNRALAYPRALLPSGGPLSREFWQLTTPLIVVDNVLLPGLDEFQNSSEFECIYSQPLCVLFIIVALTSFDTLCIRRSSCNHLNCSGIHLISEQWISNGLQHISKIIYVSLGTIWLY